MPEPVTPKVFVMSERVELVATIIMALAAIFTAWAAFECAKWSGNQATSFAKAGAARTESTRFDTQAGQLTGIDVATYSSWLAAINEDARAGLIDSRTLGSMSQHRAPSPGSSTSGSGPNSNRLSTRGSTSSSLTAPPLHLPRFRWRSTWWKNRLKAQDLLLEAEQHAKDAARANQNSDNYVLTVVAFALVLFFGGVASKLASERNQALMIGVRNKKAQRWCLGLPIRPFLPGTATFPRGEGTRKRSVDALATPSGRSYPERPPSPEGKEF